MKQHMLIVSRRRHAIGLVMQNFVWILVTRKNFLLEHTYKFCHYISLRIINWSLLPCCKSRSLIPSFWWRDASARPHFCIPWISHKQPCSDDFWIAQARHTTTLTACGLWAELQQVCFMSELRLQDRMFWSYLQRLHSSFRNN